MLKRFEVKVGIVTFVVAVICSVIDWHLSGGANPANFLSPIVIAIFAAGSSFFFARRPINRMIQAKRAQRPVQLPEDFVVFNKTIDDILHQRVSPIHAELTTMRSDLADYVAKELEFNLIHRIDDQLLNLNATDEALSRMIACIHEDLQEHVICALAFRQPAKEDLSVAASVGIDPVHRKAVLAVVARSVTAIAIAPNPIIWNKADLAQLALAIPASTERVILLPLKTSHSNQFIGCIMLCLNTNKEQVISRMVRTMKKVSDHASRIMYRIAQAEEKEEGRRRDKLTQAWTRAVLSEKLLELTSADRNSNLSILLIEGDNFMSLNQTIGRERGDELIKMLSDTIKSNVKASRTSSNLDAFYRTGAAQFAIILEGHDDTALYNIAERIRAAVAGKNGWPGDIAQWSVSIGASTPSDSQQPGQLLTAAESALAYLKQQNSSNKILFANQLPAKFRRMHSADAGMAGNLQIFDPAELLQSMAIANNSGILRVTGENGVEFWAFFTNGSLKKSKLGSQLRGDNAVIEFICTFEQGNFRFVESNNLAAGGSDDPRNLGASYDTHELNKLMLDAALAKDNMDAARTKLPNIELYVVAALENQRPALWEKLKAAQPPPSSADIILMQEMLKMANGSLKLKQLIQKMDTNPTPWLYHCASMLLEHQLIRLTAIKTYAYL